MPVIRHRHTSTVLAGNPLGDPVERDVLVYVPPGFEPSAARRYPALMALTGFTGVGAHLFNADPLGEPLDRRLDRLIGAGACPPVIVAAPDCFTRVGGSQYINNTGTGRYEDYVADEIVGFVDATYPTLSRQWGVFGKSSGGYGAILLAMHRPDVFCAVADHSGDAAFDLTFLGEFRAALDAYRAAGGPAAWLAAFWADQNRHRAKHDKPLEMLAMALCFAPDPDGPPAHAGIDWPFDLETGAFRPAAWDRWRGWDPVNLVAPYAGVLKGLRTIYVDCGTDDDYGLHWGARALVAQMRAHGIAVRHEEFADGHFNIGYRYDVSVPLLVAAITGAA